jgi:DNA-binding MarR family transcriptional regulator/catechol 2,3-dioxygenase-like lactoylglutathione lyase family enzyme
MSQANRNEYATPTLMRSARGTYAQSIRAALHAMGIDDLPRNGVFMLAEVATSGEPTQGLAADLGITKQAVSQLTDILVSRGYLERQPDADDRRRIALELTERGQQVLDVSIQGVEAVEHRLLERVSPEQIEAMRSVLIALTEIKAEALATGVARRRPVRQLRRFCPIFGVRDLDAALAHYATLGFSTVASGDGDEYGFADRDGVGLHLAVNSGHDTTHPGSAYLYVRDADELYQEWSRPGIAGHTHPAEPTPYKLLEGSHVDPDGNLIRFGSPMDE